MTYVLRTGRDNGRVIYLQCGPNADKGDPMVATADTAVLAGFLVEAANARLAADRSAAPWLQALAGARVPPTAVVVGDDDLVLAAVRQAEDPLTSLQLAAAAGLSHGRALTAAHRLFAARRIRGWYDIDRQADVFAVLP